MINDDKNKQDEFEDFDFDNFDDLDNEPLDDDLVLDAESMDDDLPAEELADFDEQDNWETDDSQYNESAPLVGKSSKNKFIIPAAIGMIVLAGAGYYALSSSSPAPSYPGLDEDVQAETSFPSDTQLVEDSSIPMPSPISAPELNEGEVVSGAPNSLENETAQDPYSPLTSGDEQGGDVLTPMPNAAALNEADNADNIDSNNQLAELDLDIPSSEQDSAISDNALSDNSDITDPLSNFDNQAEGPIAEESDNINEAPSLEITDPAGTSQNNELQNGNIESEMDSSTASTNINDAIVQEPTPTLSNDEIQALESKLSELEQSVSTKDVTIQELNKQIDLLEQTLQTTKSNLENLKAKESAAPASPAPLIAQSENPVEPRQQPAVQAVPTVKATPATKPVKLPEIAPQWELRSAQPGKAYVGIVGSKEVLVVQVGDTLQGVGRITAIAKNGQRWVVSGTNGEIVR